MASPAVNVKDGAGAYAAPTNGANVTPGNTISIQLASTAGVNTWSISCVGTDDLNVAATVTASLTIDNINKVATFTAPSAGAALIFKSQINGGLNLATGAADPTASTTFGIYTLTSASLRTIATNETTEGSASFGWIATQNAKIRQAAGGGGSALPVTTAAKVTKTANYTIVSSTDYLVICATNTGFTISLPAAPADGATFVIANTAAGNNTLGGNGHNLSSTGSTSMTLTPTQAATATWDAASTTWIIT